MALFPSVKAFQLIESIRPKNERVSTLLHQLNALSLILVKLAGKTKDVKFPQRLNAPKPKNKNQEYENIFEIQFKHSGSWGLEGSIQHSYWGPRNVGGPTNFGGWGGFGPTQYLYDSYDNNDKRKKAFFITEYAGVTQTPPSSGKFWDAETGNVIEDDNLNFTMIRYADVLLMKAEALNSIDDTSNDKYDALNEVRGRAGLTSITAADNLNKEQFAEVVLEERLHELCCEHLRRWDLIRFGKLGEYMKDHAGVTIQPYHVLYPIPQAAVDANDAITENNEGY